MDTLQEIKSKIQRNKEEKRKRLLDNAYLLFKEKGVYKTSIQDIVNKAGVAKGTFYLYFKNKEDIRNHLIYEKTNEMFEEAIRSLEDKPLPTFEENLIYVIDHVIDVLSQDEEILTFIDRDLTLGFYSHELNMIFNEEEKGLYYWFKKGLEDNNMVIENVDIVFFMITEFVAVTVYRSLTQKIPCTIDEYKPILYKTIIKILKNS